MERGRGGKVTGRIDPGLRQPPTERPDHMCHADAVIYPEHFFILLPLISLGATERWRGGREREREREREV